VCLRLVLKNLRRRSSTVCRSFLPNEDEMISTLSLSKRSFAFNTTPSTKERKREKNNTFFLRAEEAVRKRILREVGTRSTTLKFQSDASRLRIGCNSNMRKNSCVSTQPPFFFRKLFSSIARKRVKHLFFNKTQKRVTLVLLRGVVYIYARM